MIIRRGDIIVVGILFAAVVLFVVIVEPVCEAARLDYTSVSVVLGRSVANLGCLRQLIQLVDLDGSPDDLLLGLELLDLRAEVLVYVRVHLKVVIFVG